MIRRLRIRHRWLIPIIALATALVLALALGARGPAPAEELPATLLPHADRP